MMIRTMDMQDRNFDGIDDRDQQEPMAYGQAITQGPGGQMYTDTSMQTPYNPPQNMNTQTRNTDFGPVTISSPGFSGSQRMQPIQDMRARPPVQDMMIRGQATGFDGNPIRNFGPQRGIGSFQNPFGGFMGGGRGQFMRPQPPMYGGGYGMQPPMFGGGMNYGMPPMFGGGMYGGGFGMQPPMYGGGFGMMRPIYGGGFGSPFGQSFYGGIGGMFPGMGGGYGQRPPMYGGGGFGGGNYNFGPQPALPIRPQPMPIRPPMDIIRPVRPPLDGGPVPQPIQRLEREFPKDSNDSDRFNRFQNLSLRGRPASMMQTQGPDNIGGGRPVFNKGPGSMGEENLRAMPFENNLIRKGRDGMMIY